MDESIIEPYLEKADLQTLHTHRFVALVFSRQAPTGFSLAEIFFSAKIIITNCVCEFKLKLS